MNYNIKNPYKININEKEKIRTLTMYKNIINIYGNYEVMLNNIENSDKLIKIKNG